MNTILKFPLERVQRKAISTLDRSHNADILIFEGVQYERMQSPKKLVKPNKRSRKKS